MKKQLLKVPTRSVTSARRTSAVSAHEAVEVVKVDGPRGFFRFEYSYTEVSSRDGLTHVRANKTRFADGKLTRETFEGDLASNAYGQMVDEAARQMRQALSWFLPWLPGRRTDRE